MQDIEIARNAKLKNINEIAQKLGISRRLSRAIWVNIKQKYL